MCPTVMELSSSDKIHATELCGTVKICDLMKVSDVDPSCCRYLKDKGRCGISGCNLMVELPVSC